jgi:hypothetical protein
MKNALAYMSTGAMPKKEEEKFQDNNFITFFLKIVIIN